MADRCCGKHPLPMESVPWRFTVFPISAAMVDGTTFTPYAATQNGEVVVLNGRSLLRETPATNGVRSLALYGFSDLGGDGGWHNFHPLRRHSERRSGGIEWPIAAAGNTRYQWSPFPGALRFFRSRRRWWMAQLSPPTPPLRTAKWWY